MKKIETYLRIAAYVLCIGAAGVIIWKVLFAGDVEKGPIAVKQRIGESISGLPVAVATRGKALLLVLSTDCPVCEANRPFYNRLRSHFLASGAAPQMMAALPQRKEAVEPYVAGLLGNGVTCLPSLSPQQLGTQGTPSLILLDEQGKIVAEWLGKVPLGKIDSMVREINLLLSN